MDDAILELAGCNLPLVLNFNPIYIVKVKLKMNDNESIGAKLYRNKCLQRHILQLRKSHAETLKKIQDLKYQLYIFRANENNDNTNYHDKQRCTIAEKIGFLTDIIKEQSNLLKMYKQKNADFHRCYHGYIVQHKKEKRKRKPNYLKKQIQLQKAILKNKIQLNPKTSSLTAEERLVLADKQHKLKKQLRDFNWRDYCDER